MLEFTLCLAIGRKYDAKTTPTQFGNLILKGNQVDHPHMLDGLFIFILFQ